MKLTTTLNEIKEHSPCDYGWNILCEHLGKNFDHDEDINLLTILESNGIQDCLWAFRTTHQDSKPVAVKIAIEFARRVLHIFDDKYPDDERPRKAIESAEAWVNDPTEENRIVADSASKAAAAAYDAYAAANAAYAAANAAYAVANATYAAANAANAAANAGYVAAYAAANAAAYDRDAELIAQAEIIRKHLI